MQNEVFFHILLQNILCKVLFVAYPNYKLYQNWALFKPLKRP